jgi:hypothetical protein
LPARFSPESRDMKLELAALAVTGFLAFDTYYDGFYTKSLRVGAKYIKIFGIVSAGVIAYLLLKRKPRETQSLLVSAGEMFRHMPVDRKTASLVSLFTSTTPVDAAAERRIAMSGGGTTKRSVSEAKKKYVAARQEWRCAKCGGSLPACYEIDHMKELQDGGTNEVDNLQALCRNCHGAKTQMHGL